METPSGQPRDNDGSSESVQESIERIFSEALRLPRAERAAHVARACPIREVAQEILELLRYDDDEFGESALDPGAFVGVRIGGCRIVRCIGKGGMGTVFEAIQEQTGRTVALKMLRPDLAGPGSLRRFRREAIIMSRIEHPGIARVYAAGVHRVALAAGLPATGVFPFLVLQFVGNAEPLTDYSRKRSIPIGLRVALFAQVAEAVGFGHLRGIVHCDLKPQNVLVGDDGRPVVIDFGIAKALGNHRSGTRVGQTGCVAGTPRYMSPEQLLGQHDRVDARTDVFALGCLLFELLAGAHPFGLPQTPSLAEASKAVQSTGPRRLGQFDHALRGDLEAIAAKALERDPGRRYRDATELAQDLQHHLTRRPVSARKPTAAYRAVRFVQRNPWNFGSACAAFLALLGFSVFTLMLSREAQRGRDLAALRAAQYALELSDFPAVRESLAEIPESRRDFAWQALWSRAAGWVREVEFGSAGSNIYDVESARSGTVFVAASGGAVAIVDADPLGGTRIVDDPRAASASEVMSFDVDSEARRAAIGALGAAPIVLGLDDGCIVWEGPAPERWFTAVAISPDGARVFHCPPDGPLAATEIGPGAGMARTLRTRPMEGYVRSIDVSPDGSLVAVGMEPATLVLLDAHSLEERWRSPISGSRDVPDVRFCQGGNRICATAFGGRTEVFSASGQKLGGIPASSLDRVSSYAGEVSRDGGWIACGAMDWCPRIVEMGTGRTFRLPGHDGQVWSAAWNADGSMLATVGATMRVWHVPRFDPIGASVSKNPCSGIWMSACGRLAATTLPSAQRTVVFDTETLEVLGEIGELATSVAIDSARGRIAMLGAAGLSTHLRVSHGFARVWAMSSDDLRGHGVLDDGDLEWFGDGRLAVSSGHHVLLSFDGPTGRPLGHAPLAAIDQANPVIAEPGAVTSLRPVGPSAMIGATPRAPGYFRWDGAKLDHPPSVDGQIPYRRLCISGTGSVLATGDTDGKIHLIDSGSLRAVACFAALTAPCVSIAIRPQGDCIAAASADRRLTLIDPTTGGRTVRIPLPAEVSELRFTPAGDELVVGLVTGRVIRLSARASGA